MTDLLLPSLLCLTALWALARGTDLHSALVRGGRRGLELTARIAPALVMLMTAVSMLRASGAMDLLADLLSPLLLRLGIPPEVTPLLLIRPLSGSGALAVTGELLETWGPDSTVGRTAAVMMGSTETTFYTLSVYCGAAGITRTRHALPAALTADLTGFLVAALTVRLFFS